MKTIRRVCIFMLLVTGLDVDAAAIGLRNPDQSARATGQGEAFVAQADDASAIYYNPAGLTQIRGTQITFGTYINRPTISHTSHLGLTEPLDRTTFLPHFYAASDFGLERWRFGLGLNAPFGSDIEWPPDSPSRYTAIFSDLQVVSITPTVACLLSSWLSVGGSVNYLRGDTALTRVLPSGLPPLMIPAEGSFAVKAKGDGVGYNLGLLLKPHPKHSLGVTYRSGVDITLDEGTASASFPTFLIEAEAQTTLELPRSLVLGYAFRPTNKLKLEFDIEWTNWDNLGALVLQSTHPLFHGQQIPFNWKNSRFYEFGTEYRVSDTWAARGGYIFSENTVPETSFSPILPDSDRHVLSAGIGFRAGPVTLDMAYQRSISENRVVRQALDPGLLGQWESSANAAALTASVNF
jgi:long-chain fatty acid transport protein